jgi:TRAP-type C4-dicarboxylate transport system permease small subunit
MDTDPPPPRLLDALRILSLGIAGVAMVLLIAIFGWLVYGRYILNATPTWVEQLSLLLVVIITFLGAAVGVSEDGHLSVEFVRDIATPRVRLALHTISDLLMLAFGALMAWHGTQLAVLNWPSAIPLLDISEGWRIVPLILCGGMIVLFTASRIIRRFTGVPASGADAAGNTTRVD